MTGTELVERFESCSLSPDAFHHEQHVHVVWIYLQVMPLATAIERFSANLKRYAASLGKTMLYHETITWAYVILTHERIRQAPERDWESFRRANPDLMTWKPSVLDGYYRPETLASDLARTTFVLPRHYEALR